MNQVDFYIIESPKHGNREVVACRLSEKAYRHNMRVFVKVDGDAVKQRMDELMWTFRDGSFVPHAVSESDIAKDSPVVIGTEPSSHDQFDMLINLSTAVPPEYQSFKRVAEIVDADPAKREELRDRYRQYQRDGHAPQTHRL